jgi:hypothetical protein
MWFLMIESYSWCMVSIQLGWFAIFSYVIGSSITHVQLQTHNPWNKMVHFGILETTPLMVEDNNIAYVEHIVQNLNNDLVRCQFVQMTSLLRDAPTVH